ncbi:hypothetical protein [Streptomyces phytophilus]|nr:hypothetical protein [Streptomyces phytophilus]
MTRRTRDAVLAMAALCIPSAGLLILARRLTKTTTHQGETRS